MIDPEFQLMMPHTVKIASWTGQDGQKKPTYGSDVSYKAKIRNEVKKRTGGDGQVRFSKNKIILAEYVPSISVRDRITLPTGFNPSNPVIVDVDNVADENGGYYTVVFC